MKGPLVLNWGGGVNSTAVAVGYANRGIRPDLVIWSDTGGEKPETYEYVRIFAAYIRGLGWPELVTVRKDGPTLEEYCTTRGELPAIAYGFKSCSDHYKRRPVHNYVKTWAPAVEAWAAGVPVRKVLGYDADEQRRVKPESDKRYANEYPLIEWDWARPECIAAIAHAGLPVPPKSACFFCPSSKRYEVLALAETHPDLIARAIAMEAAAKPNLTDIRGLGRNWSWTEAVRADREQLRLFPAEIVDQACGCYDGGDPEPGETAA